MPLASTFAPTVSFFARVPTVLYSSTDEVDIDDLLLTAEEKMTASVSSLQTQLGTLRTGRATPNLLDRVQVSYYGAPTPLTSLATVTVQGGQQLLVTPFDKSSTADIEKAIVESDLGLTPNNAGDVIRLNIPQLTEDRRKELVKTAGSIAEKVRRRVCVCGEARDSGLFAFPPASRTQDEPLIPSNSLASASPPPPPPGFERRPRSLSAMSVAPLLTP